MTRLNFLHNRRLITFALLGITLLFGGLIVFLAIQINSRSINPDQTSASSVCRTRYDSQYCGEGQRRKITTRCDVCNPESGCTESDECVDDNVDEPTKQFCRSEDRDAGSDQCSGRAFKVDIFCESCSGEVNCEPRNIQCEGDPITPVVLDRCNVYTITPEMGNGCPLDKPNKVCAQFCSTCPKNADKTDGKECTGTCSECGGTQPPEATPSVPPTDGWPANAVCKINSSSVSKCAPASFKGGTCSGLKDKEMCFCRDLFQSNGVWYGKKAEPGGLTCGSDCGKHPEGGIFYDTECKNPYRCDPVTVITPTPVTPTCTVACANNVETTTCTYPGGTPTVIKQEPKQCDTSCRPTAKCEGVDFVTRDCNNREIDRDEDACKTPELNPIVSCQELVVTRNGQRLARGSTVSPGDVLTLNASISTGAIGSRYAFGDGIKAYHIKTPSNGTDTFHDQINPKQISLKLPSTLTDGSTLTINSAGVFKIDPKGKIATTCQNGNCDTDSSNSIITCGSPGASIYRRNSSVTEMRDVVDSTTGNIIGQSPIKYEQVNKAI